MKTKTVAPPTFLQTLAVLITEVIYGKAHFHITRVLKGTHPAIVKIRAHIFRSSGRGARRFHSPPCSKDF